MFLKVEASAKTEMTTTYVLRGLIMYYGRHYYAYFYSEKYDCWFRFDDAMIKWVGNFEDVVNACMKGRAIPRIAFYERIDILTAFLTEGSFKSAEEKLYFADAQMKKNNFWLSRQSTKEGLMSQLKQLTKLFQW